MRALVRMAPALILLAAALPPGAVHAQAVSRGPPNAVQGFSANKDKPIHIEALKLEVREKDKMATFSGDVQVVQGDTQMRCRTLVVFYEPDDSKAKNVPVAAAAGPNGEQRIRKLEARGGVIVTQKDQIATGDAALFEMKSNTVTLSGNVVVTQGQNVLRGDRLVVDMTSGVSRVESGKSGDGRVQGLFLPGSGPIGPQLTPPKNEPRRAPPQRPAPGRPLQLN